MATPLESQLAEFFRGTGDAIACVYLFGSVARGDSDAKSDIDIAVLYQQEPTSGFDALGIPLAAELGRLLGRPVDVVVMNRAPVDLVHRILRDGVLVFETDPAFRVRFEVSARSKYLDLKPVLDLYRRAG